MEYPNTFYSCSSVRINKIKFYGYSLDLSISGINERTEL